MSFSGKIRSAKRAQARQVALRSGLRVFLVCVFLAPLPLLLNAEPVRDALESSEWYDAEVDDYREYTPEDVPLPEDDWQCQPNRRQRSAEAASGGLSALLNVLVYVVVALAVAAILYLIMRIVQERRMQNDELLEDLDAVAAPTHAALPEEIAQMATGIQRGPLTLASLRDRMEAALSAGDLRLACICLYLFALLRLAGAGYLELHGDATARDYLRQLEGYSQGQELPPWAHDFQSVARLFEFALYRGRLPEGIDGDQVRAHWRMLSGGNA